MRAADLVSAWAYANAHRSEIDRAIQENEQDNEDVETAKQAYAELNAANGDRTEAGWLAWKDVRHELE